MWMIQVERRTEIITIAPVGAARCWVTYLPSDRRARIRGMSVIEAAAGKPAETS